MADSMNDTCPSSSRADRPACVAVDWGTSRFRAHLVGEDGRLLDGVASDEGMGRVAPDGFEAVLTRMCAPWLAAHPGIPVLMAGMVGSRNGWREVPYVPCPAGPDEIAAAMMSFEIAGGTTVRIVPGLVVDGPEADVMRGEETQILGCGLDDAVVVLPGTHSKWATVRDGRIESFRTFMTGEVFALFTRQSVLRLLREPPVDTPVERAAFRRGLAAASADGGLLNRAFHARSAVLRGRMAPQEVDSYLSGLLIGAEVGAAKRLAPADLPIVLVADGVVAEEYREAIAAAGGDVTLVDPQRSFVDGLIRIARLAGEVSLDRAR
ncbi:MAG: 2-dehydro-3-deoxygalactonokinase [Siculibacillus sp.]|nr:2-dehydro-3-deoxygalactonokinase [Siculibacillus sp.]